MHALRRVASPLVAVAVAALFLSCTDAPQQGPTQPGVRTAATAATAGDPALVTQVNALIDQLFTSLPRRQQAHQHFDQLVDAFARGDRSGAANKAEIISSQTIEQLQQGLIADPDGPLTPMTGVVTMLNLISAYIGATDDIVTIDANTYIALVSPSANDQTFSSGFGATVIVPGGAISQSAFLFIQQQPGGTDLASGLPPASDPYEVHFIPEIAFSRLHVGICSDNHAVPTSETRLAHELDGGTVEILPTVPGVHILCHGTSSSDATPSLPERGMFAQARKLARGAIRAFGVTPAYAGHSATMGTLVSLSELQVVITGTRVSASALGGTYGGNATINATLTDAGLTMMPGRTVTLTVDGIASGSEITDATGAASFSVSA
jgi:hypothetical protein